MIDTWIEKYWNYMILEDFDNAIPLRNMNFPQSFFKYRKLNDRTLDIIRENYIWLAEITTLNDPFECSIQFDNDKCLREYYSSSTFKTNFKELTGHDLSDKEIKSLIRSDKPFERYIELCKIKNIPFGMTADQQIEKIQKRWNEIVEETNRKLRICSFSLIKDSLLLWSHYSDEHKGICLEYDFREVDIVSTFIQPVIYRDKVFKIGLFEEYSTMRMIGSSLIKSKDWSYEHEWRVTIFRQKDYFPQKIAVPFPKAIYLGTRFHLNERKLQNELMQLANDRKIPIYYMEKHSNEYRLIEKKTQPLIE